jgi:hypothetical protein
MTALPTTWALNIARGGRCARSLTLSTIATILIVSGSSLVAQDSIQVFSSPNRSVESRSPEKYSLSGTVVNSVTGEPIRKALVQLYFSQKRSTFTDENGHFQLDGIPAGSYSISPQKPGYFSQQELQRGAQPVKVGRNAGPAVLKMTPEAVINGRVTNTAGVPLERLSVTLNFVEVREGRRHWDFKGSAITDEDGRYRFAGLRPGGYYIGAAPYTLSAETALDNDKPPKTGYPGMYYPGSPDLASASSIQLNGGEHTEADFSLQEVPVYVVSGTVSGYAANQGVGIQILDQSGVQVDHGVEFSPENGRFDVRGLAGGSYTVRAFSSAGPNESLRAESQFHLAGDLHNLHLGLAPAPSIPVVVQMEPVSQRHNHPASPARNPGSGPPVSVRLEPDGPGRTQAYSAFDSAQSRQTLSIRNVEPGQYAAIIDTRDGWYVSSAEYGQADLLTKDLTIVAGSPPSPLHVVLRNDSSSLAGTVSAPASFASQATIVAVPQDAVRAAVALGYWEPSPDKNNTQAEFDLDGLAPGEYLVYAFDHVENLEYNNREALQNYSSQAAHVTLAPDQQTKVTLELIQVAESNP